MNTIAETRITGEISEAARRRIRSLPGESLFLADWERALFLHFEVDAAALQRETPYELDLFAGRAYVSLVAFTMRGMRPRIGGSLTRRLLHPIATHEFLNVRTYVKHRGEAGIQFLAEWQPNRLSQWLGPRVFGLPYHLGKLYYHHSHEAGRLDGVVTGEAGRFSYAGVVEPEADWKPVAAGSLDEFLLERYTAYTYRVGRGRFFRVWHEPWRQCPVPVTLRDLSLLENTWTWFKHARLVGANYSPGAGDVWMGRPHTT